MPIRAQYTPPERELPDEETGPVICCDLLQLEPRVNKWGKTEIPLRFIFLLGGRPMKDGRPFAVSMFSTLPMTPKSRIRELLGAWRGKPLSDAEIKAGIDLEAFALGRKGLGTVANMPNGKGEVWPNLIQLIPLPKAMEKGTPSIKDYVRLQDRPADPKGAQGMQRALEKRLADLETPF